MIDQINELPEDGLKVSPETSRFTQNKWISRKKKKIKLSCTSYTLYLILLFNILYIFTQLLATKIITEKTKLFRIYLFLYKSQIIINIIFIFTFQAVVTTNSVAIFTCRYTHDKPFFRHEQLFVPHWFLFSDLQLQGATLRFSSGAGSYERNPIETFLIAKL